MALNSIVIEGAFINGFKAIKGTDKEIIKLLASSRGKQFMVRAVVPTALWNKEIGDKEIDLFGETIRLVGEAYFDNNDFYVYTEALELKETVEDLEAATKRNWEENMEKLLENLTPEKICSYDFDKLTEFIGLRLYRNCNNEALDIIDFFQDDYDDEAQRLFLIRDRNKTNFIISAQELCGNYHFSK